jgi:hypothetical protein
MMVYLCKSLNLFYIFLVLVFIILFYMHSTTNIFIDLFLNFCDRLLLDHDKLFILFGDYSSTIYILADYGRFYNIDNCNIRNQ